LVEEVFPFRVETGLEHALEVVHPRGEPGEVESPHDLLPQMFVKGRMPGEKGAVQPSRGSSRCADLS
jgi:hypothetical protein